MSNRMLKPLVIVLFSICSTSVFAEVEIETVDPIQGKSCTMDNLRLSEIIQNMGEQYQVNEGLWQLRVGNHAVTIFADEEADRVRIVVPITETEELTQRHLYRIMQANFDSTMDARYAIAKEILWSAYVQPLSTLTDEGFLHGLGQAVNLVDTFGSSFSSGSHTFIGGDSPDLVEKELIKELVEKGEAI